jgi:hypothetical protein
MKAPKFVKIKYWNPIRKVYLFYMNSTLFGSPKRADYEIERLEQEQQLLVKKGKKRTMTKFRVCNTAGHTLHRKKT